MYLNFCSKEKKTNKLTKKLVLNKETISKLDGEMEAIRGGASGGGTCPALTCAGKRCTITIGDHTRIESFLTSSSLSILFSMLNLLIFGVVLAIYNMTIFTVFFLASILYVVWVVVFMKKQSRPGIPNSCHSACPSFRLQPPNMPVQRLSVLFRLYVAPI